jgi:hypothetical protein
MRLHAVPDSDAPVTEGAGASLLPLLSGALKDRALHLVDALTETLQPDAGQRDASLSFGSAGLAVCDAQLARTRGDRRAADTALGRIEEAIDVLATEPLTSSLYSGFTGIAWAAETTDRLLGTEGEDRNGDIDEALTSLLRRYPEHASRRHTVHPWRPRAARRAGPVRPPRRLLVDSAVVAWRAAGLLPAGWD